MTVVAQQNTLSDGSHPNHLAGLRAGCRLAPEALFTGPARLVVDASHVAAVEHEGLSLVPLAEIFQAPANPVVGFGVPNVYLTLPSIDDGPATGSGSGSGWEKFAATMFYRQRARVVDTRGRVQGGVLFELMDLPPEAIVRVRSAMAQHAGGRDLTCARANARVLTAAGFTSGRQRLGGCSRPSRMAELLWRHGLEYDGRPVTLRVIRTNDRPVSAHFRSVLRKELASLGRFARKIVRQVGPAARQGHEPAPIIQPRPLGPADLGPVDPKVPTAELRVSSPSRLGATLDWLCGEHPIFEARHRSSVADLADDRFRELHHRLPAYPGTLDGLTKLKRYVLFSRPMVALIRGQVAAAMESQGHLPGPTLLDMLQVGDDDKPFLYSGILTGSGLKICRVENRSPRDRKRVNWVLAKHVLLAGYDPDVRFAGEVWVTDESSGRVLHVNNNSGTYKPSTAQTEAAVAFLRRAYGVTAVAHHTPVG